MAEAQLEAAMDEMDSSDREDSDDSVWVSSLSAEAMISEIDSVLDDSVFSAFVEDEAANEKLILRADCIRVEVSSISLVYDPEALSDLLDGQIAKTKFSGAVVLDTRISMHSGTGTNGGPQPNYGTCKRVSTGHATRRDTHGRLARRQARDQQRARLLSRQCYCRGHSAVYNLSPEHEIIPVRQ